MRILSLWIQRQSANINSADLLSVPQGNQYVRSEDSIKINS